MIFSERFSSKHVQRALLLAGVTLILSIPFHVKPDNFCVDDGYFYLQIARNIVQRHVSTFNDWLPTNGYHPLWMMFCCMCAWITSSSANLLQMAACLQDLCLAASIAIIAYLVSRDCMRGTVFGCILLWFTNDVLGIWRLLETDLALLLQLVVLLFVTTQVRQRQQAEMRYSLGLGCLLGLTILARLDLVFFALVVLFFHLVSPQGQSTPLRRLASILVQSLAITAVMLPYLLWNVVRFHHLLPISGAIKSSFPHPQVHPGLLLAPATLPVVLGALGGIAMLFRRKKTRFELVLMLTGIGCGVHLTYTMLFSMAWPWYFTTGYLAFSLELVWIANLALKNLKGGDWVESAALCAASLTFLLVAGVRAETNLSFTRLLGTRNVQLREPYIEPRRAFAELVRTKFAPGTRFFLFDSPGSVAFYSGLSVTPSDGLVADYEWNDQVASTGLVSYAKSHGINYFVCPVLKQGQQYDWLSLTGTRVGRMQIMRYVTPLGKRDGGSISLKDENLVFTTQTIQPGFESTYPLVGVWRLQ